MKKLLLVISIGLLSFQVEAQQLTQYSHYVLNYFGINPAVAGSSPCLDLKIGYRKQWTGVEGSPSTAFANVHGNFGKKKHNFHGIGGQVETDDVGPLSFTSLAIAYAYHMKMNSRNFISAGIGAGFMQYRVDAAGLVLPEVGFGNDPAFGTAANEFVFPIVNFGLWYYNEDRFIGFSVRNVSNNNLTTIGSATRITPHYSLTAGKHVEMEEGFAFKPSAHLKYVASSRLSIDVTAMINYKDKLELGAGFRSESGIIGLLRVDLFKYVTLGYAYDRGLSRMRFGSPHTHEVVLGIKACALGDKRGVPCAAYQ